MELVVIDIQCHDEDELNAVKELVERRLDVSVASRYYPVAGSPEPHHVRLAGWRKPPTKKSRGA
ncbi:hypothetical protein [Amycolatopsis sp. NPDC051903]|uniref:hypothetical protein n=1 Tax=Amycolatopsis sp. NPDC051903 TaxID=3363936 RepID=UPI00378CC9F8